MGRFQTSFTPNHCVPLRWAALSMGVLLAIYMFAPSVAGGQESLRKLLKSEEYTRFRYEVKKSHNPVNTTKYNRRFPKGFNYTALFVEEDGSSRLADWLDLNQIKEFKEIRQAQRTKDYVRLIAVFAGAGQEEIELQVLVPDHNVRDQVQFKFHKEFQKFEPPVLKVENSSLKTLSGLPVEHFRTEDQNCALLFKLNRDAILNLKAACTANKDLLRIAKQLNLSRLNENLNS